MLIAHIAGVPVEESIGTIAPLLGVGSVVLGVQVGALRRQLRRRRGIRASAE
jgi:hypothetical protein